MSIYVVTIELTVEADDPKDLGDAIDARLAYECGYDHDDNPYMPERGSIVITVEPQHTLAAWNCREEYDGPTTREQECMHSDCVRG